MSQEERYGSRDQSYSAWHRRNSTRRFVGIEQAQLLAMIDVDVALYVEYDDGSKDPVALIEVAKDVGQENKAATITKRLAERAKVPAFTVLYKLAEHPNPADPQWPDIAGFRVRMLNPYCTEWKPFTPDEWARKLLELRSFAAGAIDVLWREIQ